MEPVPKYVRGEQVLDTYDNRIGTITGKFRESQNSVKWQVSFGQNEIVFIDEKDLEKHVSEQDLFEAYDLEQYGKLTDLRRLIQHKRMKSNLTNVYYSMYNGRAEFMPHQFKPVMKYIESTTGRLLIADEVGLGKTIEALYIWKEMVARNNAKRLLLVVPSTLREKWRNDMANYFGLEAEIVDAKTLLEKLQRAKINPNGNGFLLITSLEGIRYKDTDGDSFVLSSTRGRLAEYLEELGTNVNDLVLDLTIIDEAHYLRNSGTASFKTGVRLRDISDSLVLLSATPIQTSHKNFFNLLQLMEPEEYYDLNTFNFMIEENRKLVDLANSIQLRDSFENVHDKLLVAKTSYLAQNDTFFENLEKNIAVCLNSSESRMDTFQKVSNRFFYSRLVSRSRKRDVFEKRIIRHPETLDFKFTEHEQDIYDNVTAFLQQKTRGQSAFSVFPIIARQRQMTSSLPAAFIQWKTQIDDDDQLFDDLGMVSEQSESSAAPFNLLPLIEDIDIVNLIEGDSKYQKLIGTIQKCKSQKMNKIIVFSFYRGTISYITSRLQNDRINAVSIMGGMGDEKNAVIERFRSDADITVLVSSEVGSEGIDLQFSSVIINYDLPWNPMRLEQRIGRIDRIGQKADKIFIYNLTCTDTIEDRVLDILYDRIDIFKTSIGDIEDILGDKVQELAFSLMNPDLTPEEKQKQAEQTIDAIAEQKRLSEELENKASLSAEYREHLLRNINISNRNGRYISSHELKQYLLDFFDNSYQDSRIETHNQTGGLVITLSLKGRESLSSFLASHYPDRKTALSRSSSGTLCLFDLSALDVVKRREYEFLNISHPLIRWINYETENALFRLHRCSIFSIDSTHVNGTTPGWYAFEIMGWRFDGYLTKYELHYFMANNQENTIEPEQAEYMIHQAMIHGEELPYWMNESPSLESKQKMMEGCYNSAWANYEKAESAFNLENQAINEKQKIYLEMTYQRKISAQENLIQNLIANNRNEGVIKMNSKKLDRLRDQFALDIEKLNNKRSARCEAEEICIGLIKVV